MIEQLRRKREEESGFTLIELLIVIIILGILAAIVVFAIGNTRKDSVANSCKTNYKAIQLSAEAQNTNGGSYPLEVAAGTDDSQVHVNTKYAALLTPGTPAGALLKTSYPFSKDYRLVYAHVAGPPETYTLVVQNGTGTVVGAGGTPANASATDCESL